MTNPQIIDYIKGENKKGTSRDDVIRHLMQDGKWSFEDVQLHLNAVDNEKTEVPINPTPINAGTIPTKIAPISTHNSRGRNFIILNVIIFALYIGFRVYMTIGSYGNDIPVAPTLEMLEQQQLQEIEESASFKQVYFGWFLNKEGWEIWSMHLQILGLATLLSLVEFLFTKRKEGVKVYFSALVVIFALGIACAMMGLMETTF